MRLLSWMTAAGLGALTWALLIGPGERADTAPTPVPSPAAPTAARTDSLARAAGPAGPVRAGTVMAQAAAPRAAGARPAARPANGASGSAAGPQLGVGASLGGRRVFPPDNPWNTPIDHCPVDPNSTAIITKMAPEKNLHPDFGPPFEGKPIGIPYVVVPGSQPKIPVQFEYMDESDHGLYPIPPNPSIEPNDDAHLLMVDRDNWRLYELFALRRISGRWVAGSGAIYDLNSNDLRPAGWTSADAAGLPILPGLVRYDEVMEQKEIRHALRFTASPTRRAYMHPARHWASRHTDALLPPMGMRVRLKASYDISGFSPPVQVILRCLKKYGMILADNGSTWFISGAPDPRWSNEQLADLKRVKGKDLEVILMTNVVAP